MTDPIEQKARELLAAEFERDGMPMEGGWAREGSGADSPYIRAIAAALRSVEPFANAGDSEHRFVADGRDLNCPACGGSGHVDDVQPSAPEPVRWQFRAIHDGAFNWLDCKDAAEADEAVASGFDVRAMPPRRSSLLESFRSRLAGDGA